jgi:hypothetical protein
MAGYKIREPGYYWIKDKELDHWYIAYYMTESKPDAQYSGWVDAGGRAELDSHSIANIEEVRLISRKRKLSSWEKFSAHYKLFVSSISSIALIIAGIGLYFFTPFHKSSMLLGIIGFLQFFVVAELDREETRAREIDNAQK